MTLAERHTAVRMLTAGMTGREVAVHFGRSESRISRLWTKHRLTGTVIDRPRSGSPRKTTAREDRFIIMTSRRNRFMTSGTIATRLRVTTGVRITDQTVRNRLRAARLRGHRPYMGVPLTLRHCIARVNWVCAHQRLTHDDWKNVLFTDESRFNLFFANGRLRAWRRHGERYDPANILERDYYGGGSVMVWAGICHYRKTELVTVQYCGEIIQPAVLPFLRQGHATIFQ